jgi:DNA repair protein RecO (recombination protein O)
MNQLVTTGIVLSRTDFGEADRIITILTPDYGKLRLMGKGVRRVKSKLAGGIELFSVSNITFIHGRSDIGTLISTRLIRHYGHIVNDITRVQLGYELIKTLNKITEDQPEPEYFVLLEQTFQSLDKPAISELLVRCWYIAQLLRIGGHSPNLQTDTAGQQLTEDSTYNFSIDDMSLISHKNGRLTAEHIKFLRLLFGNNEPKTLQRVAGIERLLVVAVPMIQAMAGIYLHV